MKKEHAQNIYFVCLLLENVQTFAEWHTMTTRIGIDIDYEIVVSSYKFGHVCVCGKLMLISPESN